MRVLVRVMQERIEIPCGVGNQHVRWLGLVAAVRYAREYYPHAFMLPQLVMTSDGVPLKPRTPISEAVEDGGELIVQLREAPGVETKEVHEGDMGGVEDESTHWFEDAYGNNSNLMDCKFEWKKADEPDKRKKGEEPMFPTHVVGTYVVHSKWRSIYPNEEYGGKFEVPLEPSSDTSGAVEDIRWEAFRKGPPGSCSFRFYHEEKNEYMLCKGLGGSITGSGEHQHHHMEFQWDVPIGYEPFPEVESRPSTASSADGAQTDPRFEADWAAMKLTWVDHRMKMRVKDVLVEFYSILIDLFDSYAFMGLDLSSSNQTIGMDDVKHLLVQCELLAGQKYSLPWSDICGYYTQCVENQDVKAYLPQRIQRHVYLELLLRCANHTHCMQNKASSTQPMRLDEGFFRFITDVLIPVMDVFDDDPIRKHAVEHDNLIAIQQKRPSLRSVYSFLSQPWEFEDKEPLLPLVVLELVLNLCVERAEKEEGGISLSPSDAQALVDAFQGAVDKSTAKRTEPQEQIAVYFWEFFEIFMTCTLALPGQLHLAVHKVVEAWVEIMHIIDREQIALPGMERDEPPPPEPVKKEETPA